MSHTLKYKADSENEADLDSRLIQWSPYAYLHKLKSLDSMPEFIQWIRAFIY